MSRSNQKIREKMFCERASCLLNEKWQIEKEEESPDFIISDSAGSFGVEITECHIGEYSQKGSQVIREEQERKKTLEKIREKCVIIFPYIAEWRIIYQSRNKNISEKAIIDALKKIDQNNKEIFETIPLYEKLKNSGLYYEFGAILVSKGYGGEWEYTDDMSGPVLSGADNFQRCINAKAKKIDSYRKKTSNIRLLVVADALMNSGKASLPEGFRPDICGFDEVYYLYFPIWISVFPSDHTYSCDIRFPTRLRI